MESLAFSSQEPPFGDTARDRRSAGFQHFWLKGRQRGLAGDFGDCCLEPKAVLESKFAQREWTTPWRNCRDTMRTLSSIATRQEQQ